MARASQAVELFATAAQDFEERIRFNKATLFSWLCFVAEVRKNSSAELAASALASFVNEFEMRRSSARVGEQAEPLLLVFNDRASSRVADISSVLARDFVLWYYWVKFGKLHGITLGLTDAQLASIREIAPAIKPPPPDVDLEVESALMETFARHRWGERL